MEAEHGCPTAPVDACGDDLSAALWEGVVSSPIPSEGACLSLLGSGFSWGFTLWCPLLGGVSAVCDHTGCSWNGVSPPPFTVHAPASVLTARNLKPTPLTFEESNMNTPCPGFDFDHIL